MTNLLEIKEKLKNFYGKYDIYILPFLKFLLAFGAFYMINSNIGFMKRISGISVALILALVCAVLPVNTVLIIGAVLILLHLYALSLEVAVTAVVLFLILFLLYFRFSPRDGVNTILMPICMQIHIGPVLPVAAGLLGEAYSVVSVICGTILYYFLRGISENATLLSAVNDEDAKTSKFVVTMNQLVGNKEMYLVISAFAVVTLLVFFIRRLSINHAWTVAIITGALVNFTIQFAGFLLLGISGKIISLIIGTVAAVIAALAIEFLFFNLDYTRTERVQFEDDEYYYYVKAIPKLYVAKEEKQVKKITSKGKRQEEKERFSRKQLSDELDINEEFFK